MCMCVCIHAPEKAEALDPLDLELLVVVSSWMWALGAKLEQQTLLAAVQSP